MSGRKMVICNVCLKEKQHFGLGMCSACLRNHKRKTKPSFYLGTCYSEISRRVKTYDPSRKIYLGLEKCTKDEFIQRFIDDECFLKNYKNWQDNNYRRKFAPSIDRIDNTKGYTLDNMQFLNNNENALKAHVIPTSIKKDEKVLVFKTRTEAAEFLETTTSILCKALKLKKLFKGWEISNA